MLAVPDKNAPLDHVTTVFLPGFLSLEMNLLYFPLLFKQLYTTLTENVYTPTIHTSVYPLSSSISFNEVKAS